MSLLYTPQKAQEQAQSSAAEPPAIDNSCVICKETIVDNQEILIITTCSHEFHRACIEHALSQSAECPQCKCACELVDLIVKRSDNTLPKNSPKQKTGNSNRGKPRGAMAKKHFTRNYTKSLGQEFSQQSSFEPNGSHVVIQTDERIYSPQMDIRFNRPENFVEQCPQPNNSQNYSNAVDYSQLNQMIENTVTRLLRNLNIVPNSINQNQNIQANVRQRQTPPVSSNNQFLQPPQYHTSEPLRQNLSGNHYIDPNYSLKTDKITAIIQNWNIKFDGSNNGLTVEEFLYRVRSLTTENFSGDFNIICKHLPMLLTGKARDWYWRYHKQVDRIEWTEFCAALRYQYKNFKSNFDVREEVRNRKMRSGETFEVFYDNICSMLDRLETPMPESELVELLTRNLRPDIRHELLYVPIYSIAHLRKLVQMRENLLADDYFRRHPTTKPAVLPMQRRTVAEVEFLEDKPEDITNSYELSVDAIRQGPNAVKCWNCDEPGHHWEDCVKDRIVFCYGCGTKNVYKPQCPRCLARKISVSKN
uniref:E3 ubiquitin-protein ligase n=1 Tax=Calliphora vicina TaxID=7373 RepID=A0A0K3CT45_CALVI|nr:unnamed protein product [Calliphora vicina]